MANVDDAPSTAHVRARRRAAAAVLAAALAASAVVAVLVVRDRPSVAAQFVPAPSASPTLIARTAALGCDLSTTSVSSTVSPEPSSAPVVAGSPGRTLLQEGWVWQDEPDGYRVGVPGDWHRTATDAQVCYRDPAGRRRLTVQTGASIDPDRVGAWMDAERQLLAGNPPDGYRRVDIAAVDFRAGGADWEYTYQANGETWHVLRRGFAVDALRAYVLTWTTPDADWDDAQPDFRAAATSFDVSTS